MTLHFHPIGLIKSCFQTKFGIPRQPNLAPSARGMLILNPEYSGESVRGLEAFSHLWITFYFHATAAQSWKKLIKPPKLGSKIKVGVFASRSNFRPNPIGLSVVKLESIEHTPHNTILHLSGLDILTDTPVLDIRPYLPYCDSVPNAQSAYAKSGNDLPRFPIIWHEHAKHMLGQLCAHPHEYQHATTLIEELLTLDPRPGYHDDPERHYQMSLDCAEVVWCVRDCAIEVLEIRAPTQTKHSI